MLDRPIAKKLIKINRRQKQKRFKKADLTIVSEKREELILMVDRTKKEKKNLENGICFESKIQIKIGYISISIDYSEKKHVNISTDR